MRGEAALRAGLVLVGMLLCAMGLLLLCFAGAGALVRRAMSGLHNAAGEPHGRDATTSGFYLY